MSAYTTILTGSSLAQSFSMQRPYSTYLYSTASTAATDWCSEVVHCSRMRIPLHSPWLPGYTDVIQTVLIILRVAGLFPDRPHKYGSVLSVVSGVPRGFWNVFPTDNVALLYNHGRSRSENI